MKHFVSIISVICFQSAR